MSAAKHTPGPWSAYVDRSTKTIAVDIGPDPHGRRPCIVDWTGFDGCDLPLKQRIANAYLIAAAPMMYEALQAYDAWADKTLPADKDLKALREQMRAAIAKAEGQ